MDMTLYPDHNFCMILQIETATTTCSVALAHDDKVLAFKEATERNIHAGVITTFIDEILGDAGVEYHQLDAVAVSSGPGSYTGLRIGISTAKGLCFALDKPLIAIDTLQAMAYGAAYRAQNTNSTGVLFCPMIDARRMEVFTAVFSAAQQQLQSTSAEIIDEHSFGTLLKDNKVLFFGDGSAKCKAVLGNNSNSIFMDEFTNSARDLSIMALKKFVNKDFEDVAYFEPYYLKEFIAGKKAL